MGHPWGSLRGGCRAGRGPRVSLPLPRPRRPPCRAHRLTPADDELYQRTRVTVLEPESPNTMFIEGYSSRGFTISGDLVVGPCAVLPRTILQWNVSAWRWGLGRLAPTHAVGKHPGGSAPLSALGVPAGWLLQGHLA